MDRDDIERHVLAAIERAALVFYVDGRWRPFAPDSPESRVTRPDESTTVQFNSLPGRPPHAEYRGVYGRWWVHVDAADGMPVGEPHFAPAADATSTSVS